MTPAINDQTFMRAAIAASRAAMAAGGDLLQDEAVAVLREFAART